MNGDEQLLQLLRTGRDDRALTALYAHLPGIRRMIRFYGGRRDEAEDIFQEALIVLCRKALDPSFKLSNGAYSYLYSVSRYLWNDELKRNKRRPLILMEDTDPQLADIADAVEDESRFRLAERIIDSLADRCRELLSLFYAGRLKLRDIAGRMGYASEQSAKNQKYKCLEAAREQYRQAILSENL